MLCLVMGFMLKLGFKTRVRVWLRIKGSVVVGVMLRLSLWIWKLR